MPFTGCSNKSYFFFAFVQGQDNDNGSEKEAACIGKSKLNDMRYLN